MFIVECWIEHQVRQVDRTFTYLSMSKVESGVRIKVNFNRKELIAFVERCTYSEESLKEITERLSFEPKFIISVIDSDSLITEELHELALWMKETTLSTTISCFKTMLPSKLKPVSNTKKPVEEKWVKLSEEEHSLTPKQLEAYLYVSSRGEVRYAELRAEYPNIARLLIDKGCLIPFFKEKTNEYRNAGDYTKPLKLNSEQQAVYDEVINSDDLVFLLKGVTGSGKTEVYLQLAQHSLNQNKQVLILVPEISLTPQMISRVSGRFGEDLAIYHSGLNDQEKYEQYCKVKAGQARIVVGTRSAVFLPFTDLGLIVLDEEHDTSYKQENQPSYHCRDVAVFRGKYHHCKVILGSATPSLESYARAIKHVYHLLEMNRRVNHTLPEVSIVSLKESLKSSNVTLISRTLQDKMEERFRKNQQVILLLNRRGFSTQLRCRNCSETLLCPHCDLAMSYHKDENLMKCHTCGTSFRIPKNCPSCHQSIGFTSFGYGTQRLEEEVNTLFPGIGVLRMDADTTGKKNSHEKILNEFGEGKAQVLVGTQMIAKGLDYPRVTLVGVLNGDEGLNRTDYRSCETTFDLLMQAGGRSGRSDEKGEVVFQVFDPDHFAVVCASRQDYDMFFKQEMQFRHAGMYPPYTYVISLTISGIDREKTRKEAESIIHHLNGSFKTIGVISLLKIQDRYRNRILLKGQNLDEMRESVRNMMNSAEFKKIKDIRIDINPITLD